MNYLLQNLSSPTGIVNCQKCAPLQIKIVNRKLSVTDLNWQVQAGDVSALLCLLGRHRALPIAIAQVSPLSFNTQSPCLGLIPVRALGFGSLFDFEGYSPLRPQTLGLSITRVRGCDTYTQAFLQGNLFVTKISSLT